MKVKTLEFSPADTRRLLGGRAEGILSAGPTGLITDVDGTISRIVDDPDSAVVDPEAVELLGELGRRLALVALLSGRSVSQLRRLVGSEGLVYVGNHGLEWWQEGQKNVALGAAPYRGFTAAILLGSEAAQSRALGGEESCTQQHRYPRGA